jgi:hypothetical protein
MINWSKEMLIILQSDDGTDKPSTAVVFIQPCSVLDKVDWLVSGNCCEIPSSELSIWSSRDRHSVVCIETRYGLDCPEFAPCKGEIFRTSPDRLRSPRTYRLSRYLFCVQRVKRQGPGVEHPTPYTYLLTPWSRVLLEKLTSFRS